MFAFLDDLNERQLQAATCTDRLTRILAGPGTGKTTTLCARVAHLMSTGTSPEQILLLTFSRRAARTMIARTRRRTMGERGPQGRIAGGTFHAVAHHALRSYATSLGLSENFSLLDTGDAADVLDLVRAESLRRRSPRRSASKGTLATIYSRSVNASRPVAETMAEVAPWCVEDADEYAAIFRTYVARKRALALVDFDDLLVYFRALLQDDVLGERFVSGVDHLLIDEYQDVNQIQVDIAAAMVRRGSALTIVGDDAQAIYSFRGSSPRYLLEADTVFPSLTTITLDINYRSTPHIISAINAVALDAPSGFSSILRPADDAVSGPRAKVVHCGDEATQTEYLCERILDNLDHGIPLREQAVLFRTAHHSASLELELTRRRIPYVKYGGLRYLEAAHVKDLLALYRVADNALDAPAWFRLLRLLPGVGPVTARRVVDTLTLDASVDTTASHTQGDLIRSQLGEEARTLFDPVLAALADARSPSVAVRADQLRDAIEPLLCAVYDDADVRLVDLDALVTAASDCARLSDVSSLFVLEPTSSTGDLADDPSIDEDWLVLSTIHSAKGLEFHSVFLMHAADGNIPSDMAVADTDGVEEERRLFYVALSRARRDLTVTVPLRYHHKPPKHPDAHSWALPSRFLSTRVVSCMEERHEGLDELAPLAGSQQDGTSTVQSRVDDLLGDLFGAGSRETLLDS